MEIFILSHLDPHPHFPSNAGMPYRLGASTHLEGNTGQRLFCLDLLSAKESFIQTLLLHDMYGANYPGTEAAG